MLGLCLNLLEELLVKNRKTINGRICNQLSIEVDISKLSREEKYFIFAISGLSSVKEPDKYAAMIDSFSMEYVCNRGCRVRERVYS